MIFEYNGFSIEESMDVNAAHVGNVFAIIEPGDANGVYSSGIVHVNCQSH